MKLLSGILTGASLVSMIHMWLAHDADLVLKWGFSGVIQALVALYLFAWEGAMSSKTKMSLTLAAMVMPIFPFIFWCSGFDFDQRGEKAVACAITTIFATIVTFAAVKTFPE